MEMCVMEAAWCYYLLFIYNHLQAQLPLVLESLLSSFMDYHPYIQWFVLLCEICSKGPEEHLSHCSSPNVHTPTATDLIYPEHCFQDFWNGLSSERDRRENSLDTFSLFLDSNLFLCLGADLKERAKMDDAEVGHFVKRLRNLMDEIGKWLSQSGNLS